MTTSQVLSAHRAIAEFAGVQHFPCRFKTSICPDQCTHARDAATFKIETYEAYEKKGEYGDAQQTVFRARIDQREAREGQDPEIVAKIQTLSPGQKVRIAWEHLYVTETATGSKWPERHIVALDVL
jgi:hypothetical protein